MSFEERQLEEYKKVNPNELTEKQFLKIQKEMANPKKSTISDEYFDFKLWCSGGLSRQEYFAKYLAKRLQRKKAQKVLEVGCGRTFRLSRMLSQEGFDMTCIDPKIEIPDDREEQIICVNAKFDLHYDLTEFDFIVAQEPCDATEHIVRACVEQKKPFVIALCGVPHKLMSGKKPKDVYEWYEYLVNISREDNIRLRNVQLNSILKTPILLKD